MATKTTATKPRGDQKTGNQNGRRPKTGEQKLANKTQATKKMATSYLDVICSTVIQSENKQILRIYEHSNVETGSWTSLSKTCLVYMYILSWCFRSESATRCWLYEQDIMTVKSIEVGMQM